MSLKVWLPLNGNLENKGLDDVTVTNNNTTISDTGKIGKCYIFGNENYLSTNYNWTTQQQFSVFVWVKKANKTDDGTLFRTTTKYSPIIDFNGTNGGLRIFYWYNETNYHMMTAPSIEANTWCHLGITFDGTTFRFYINGEVTKSMSATSTPYITGTLNIGKANNENYFKGSMNDFRIYDHCLSAKEVHEIAKGLVLHYKMTNSLGDINPNLCRNTNTDSLSTNTFYMSTQYGGKIREIVNEDGISCVKITRDDVSIDTGWVYLQYQSWDVKSVKTNTSYVVSVDMKSSTNGTMSLTGFLNGNATNYISKTVTPLRDNTIVSNQWCHCSWLVTTKDNFDGITVGQQVVYFGGSKALYGVNETLMVKNLKVEEGSVETPWIPHVNDGMYSQLGFNSTSISDCSGYKNDAEIILTPSFSNDTPRYNSSMVFDNSNRIVATSNYSEAQTMSIWVYIGSSVSQGVVALDKKSQLAIGFNASTIIVSCAGRSANAYTFDKIKLNSWNLFTVVKNETTNLLYINGELCTDVAGTNNWIQNTDEIIIGCRNNGSYATNYSGKLSDFRMYASALSEDDVLELYEASASIDKDGNYYAREIVEG